MPDGPYLVLTSADQSFWRCQHVGSFAEAWGVREDEQAKGRTVILARIVETRVVEVEPRHAPVVGGVRGERLRELIAEVAVDLDDEPLHYKTLMAMVESRGVEIGGKNPEATFLTHLTRVPGIVAVGKRSGLYRKVADA